jgi:rhodanese-related sulfurtransferase
MKKIIFAAASALLLTLTACSGGNGYHTESVDAFAATIADPAVVVIDVRTPEEFATGHIANAVNMNVEGADFDAQVSNVTKSASVAVYCHSGRRSAIAADKMVAAGFKNIHNLDGGISAWTAAGQPVTQ